MRIFKRSAGWGRQMVFVLLLIAFRAYASESDVVSEFGRNLNSWTVRQEIPDLLAMERLCSEVPSIRIADVWMSELARENNLAETANYEWNVFITCLQKHIDRGATVALEDVREVPEDYVEQSYPGVSYVACRLRVDGPSPRQFDDVFIIKNGKIVKITDYVETVDAETGKKKIEIDYLELARSAFADGDYSKCYDFYRRGALRELKKEGRHSGDFGASQIFPFVESCVALGKWDEAMHGITDDHRVTNRKTWVNGREWKLEPEDIRTWNPDKQPLMDLLLKKIFIFYVNDPSLLAASPLVNHISKTRSISVGDILGRATLFFWNDRKSWLNSKALVAAATLGHLEAQKELGNYFLTGKNDEPLSRNKELVVCDTLKAVSWYDRAASGGDLQASNMAAHFYLSGRGGVARDPERAFTLYSLNNSDKDYDSMLGLALCHYFGLGTAVDLDKAVPMLIEAEDWRAEIPYLIGMAYFADGRDARAVKYLSRVLSRPKVAGPIRRAALETLALCRQGGLCGLEKDASQADAMLVEAEGYEKWDEETVKDFFISLTLPNND